MAKVDSEENDKGGIPFAGGVYHPGNVSANDKEEGQKNDESNKSKTVSYSTLHRFATPLDYIMIVFALVCALVVGIAMPLMFIIFGDVVDNFSVAGKYGACFDTLNATYLEYNNVTEQCPDGDPVDYESNKICPDFENCLNRYNMSRDDLIKDLFSEQDFLGTQKALCLQFVYLGLGAWLAAFIMTTLLLNQANNQMHKIRQNYFRGILRQDISFFDVTDTGVLNTRLVGDMKQISDGIGLKTGIFVQETARFFGGMIVGFYYGWKLTLVIFGTVPVMAIVMSAVQMATEYYTKLELDAYASAGGVAEETLSSIKTVTAFGAQNEEAKRYESGLAHAKNLAIKKTTIGGLAMGVLYFVFYAVFGFTLWYGGILVVTPEENYTVGHCLIVLFAISTGAMSLATIGESVKTFSMAKSAGATIFEIIDRIPDIDRFESTGKNTKNIAGTVKFHNVHFKYPARNDVQVLENISFEASEGQRVALCGQSGCGKSTIVQLIQRFYDPQEGYVEIGNTNIKEFNLLALRNIIGVVSQEPILFETTIADNIRYGRMDVSIEEIREAARQSNCYDFITALPQKFETFVGEGGSQLSGGEKQRIAIARALVRNPKILLLDEATSALDTKSESVVQSALDKASEGRTTIVVAHRLSTIRNANKIIVFADGKIAEEGNHESLSKLNNGVYAGLCKMQTFKESDKDQEKPKKIEKKKSETNAISEKRSGTSATKLLLDVIGKTSRTSITKSKNEKTEDEAPLKSIVKLNAPEWGYIVIGLFGSALTGASIPFFSIIFSMILGLFGEWACAVDGYQGANPINGTFTAEYCGDMLVAGLVWSALAFVVLGAVSFVGFIIQGACYGKAGEELTLRLRSTCFRKFMKLDMEYFDHPLHSTGALTTRLAKDASQVQGATGARLGLMVANMFSLVSSYIVACYYSWQMALVATVFLPISFTAAMIQMQTVSGSFGGDDENAYEDSGKLVVEATLNIRTVAGLTREETFLKRFDDKLSIPLAKSRRKSIISGIAYGVGQCTDFFSFAACFYFGAWLITKGKVAPTEYEDVFKALMAILFGASALGENSAFAADFGEAKKSATQIIKLLNTNSTLDPTSKNGIKPVSCSGDIQFQNIKFNYPGRADVKVLDGLSISIKRGQTLALVGHSGCGKSTCIQLIERFYNASDGSILLDGTPLSSLNLEWLRRQIGFVQQEPSLFNKTISENISYGLEEGFYILDDIKKAAEAANALNFIEEFPNRFETKCGTKGSQLSGGQKQRVAIARAIIRNPPILLLDEATSALDAESEKVVQDALDRARQGRTVILIAHRLSTVINADVIGVVQNGMISEFGTHQQLISKKGEYYSLVNSQL